MEDDPITKKMIDEGYGQPTTSHIDNDTAAQVNVIMLWRIYDVLLLALATQDPDAAGRIAKAHEEGNLLGPNPAFRPAPVEASEE